MVDTLQVDLDVVLPDAHDGRDRCVSDLVAVLEHLDGVESVHVIDEDSNAKVCLHIAAGAVGLPRLEERVQAAGATVGQRYGHVLLKVVPAGHAARASALTSRVRSLTGVVDAAVSIEGVARIEFEQSVLSESDLVALLPSVGVVPVAGALHRHGDIDHDHGVGSDGHAHGHSHGHGARRIELVAAFVSLLLYLVARSLDSFTDIEGSVMGLYIAAAVVTGVFVAQDAWLSVRARVFDIDQLMLVAAIGAACIGHWSDAALLLVLFSLGHALEGHAMNRARTAIESLGELAPAVARLRDEPHVETPIEELKIGDVVLVRPDERLPVDGVLIRGEASIDESAVTGESVPVDKKPLGDTDARSKPFADIDRQHRVFAGTLNGTTAIDVLVRRVAADSTLARVVELVAEAETQISPSQRFTNRLVRVFVPMVLALVVGLLIVPPLAGEPFRESFGRAMAVLVAASPCALAIATPSAVLAAIARAARNGILVKGGGPLETLGAVSAIAFDKTGTLTEGRPILTDVEPAHGVSRRELLAPTLALESASDHPLARSIVTAVGPEFAGATLAAVADVQAVHGKGITGTFAGVPHAIGATSLFDHSVPDEIRDTQQRLEAAGRTTMIVRAGHRFLGVLGVMDTPRAEAKATVAALRDLGVESIVMLSGDNQIVAEAVGQTVGISTVRGGLLPTGKVDALAQLAGDGVAMVGDGVNDAPALAAANVGIAMGAAGSDVALETADIALMADRIEALPLAVGLARRATRTIRQNLFFSLAVVAVLIPMTMLGIGISVAVIAHEGSTLIVVANALRLLRD